MNEETRALEELMRDFKEHNTKYAKNYEDICYNAIQSLQQQLKDKDEKISKALNKISERCDYIKDEYEDSFDCCIEELSNIEKILESNKED